jgi:hypothetical protein
MTFVVPVLLLATVFAFTNFLKFLVARDWNAALTTLVVWAGGFGVVWLAAQTTLFGNFAFNAVPLKLLKTADLIFIGINIGSGGILTNELKKAFDRSDTATTPMLFPSLSQPEVVTPTVQTQVPPARRGRPIRART